MMFQPVKKPTKAQLFVIGAAEDQVISQKEINSTAKFHGVKPIIMNNLGHNMMLDKESEQVLRKLG